VKKDTLPAPSMAARDLRERTWNRSLVPAADHAPCPLCTSARAGDFARDGRRTFLRCAVCSLVFVPPSQHLTAADEKMRYDLHRNAPDDDGYRRFLGRMVAALQPFLAAESRGLDFGSGPEPVLARMFEEAGLRMAVYDPFYEPDRSALEGTYDFITATEVVEHLREPLADLDLLWQCLRPGGWLGIMTRRVVGRLAFPGWQYKNDLTHICFFSPPTFAWLSRRWDADLLFSDDDIALFRKSGSPA